MIDIIEIINKNEIETPAHIIDLNKIYQNFQNINLIKKETGIKIFLALKGFSNDKILKKIY